MATLFKRIYWTLLAAGAIIALVVYLVAHMVSLRQSEESTREKLDRMPVYYYGVDTVFVRESGALIYLLDEKTKRLEPMTAAYFEIFRSVPADQKPYVKKYFKELRLDRQPEIVVEFVEIHLHHRGQLKGFSSGWERRDAFAALD